MKTPIITIVYHSGFGHTRMVAELLAETMNSESVQVHVLNTQEATLSIEKLHEADTIIFGSPTYFGTFSAEFKKFMEETGKFWYKQTWKDKLAAGFTVSATLNGDKLNTLNDMSLFAAQHGMLWISQGVLPRFINDFQTDGQNRLGSYLGLMIQSDNSVSSVKNLHPGDRLTLELFAERVLSLTKKLKSNS
ncbi:MAG: flavodoxin family protein [Bacteroidia bacterium]|nr:flavodoxin family protein [Bacteroidia bacterium]